MKMTRRQLQVMAKLQNKAGELHAELENCWNKPFDDKNMEKARRLKTYEEQMKRIKAGEDILVVLLDS